MCCVLEQLVFPQPVYGGDVPNALRVLSLRVPRNSHRLHISYFAYCGPDCHSQATPTGGRKQGDAPFTATVLLHPVVPCSSKPSIEITSACPTWLYLFVILIRTVDSLGDSIDF
jgi:hypothetical protein